METTGALRLSAGSRGLRAHDSGEPLVVVNVNASGAGEADRVLRHTSSLVAGFGTAARGLVTASEAELHEALATAAGRRRVVLVGGDGSLAAAVNAPLRSLPELALVPAGRANNVARALGIPLDRREAARVAVTAPARRLDLLCVETGDRSLLAVEGLSAGFHAAARSSYGGANSADLLQGTAALLRAIRAYEPYEICIRVAGRRRFAGPAAQLFLSNLPYFGFGFHVNPIASPHDGLMEALVLEAATRRAVVRLLLATYRGDHLGLPGVTLTRAPEVTIESELPLVADATPLGTGTASVRVEQGRAAVAAPLPGSAA